MFNNPTVNIQMSNRKKADGWSFPGPDFSPFFPKWIENKTQEPFCGSTYQKEETVKENF